VYIGSLTDVLDRYLSVETNAKTHNFWVFNKDGLVKAILGIVY